MLTKIMQGKYYFNCLYIWGVWIAQISYLMTVTARIAAQVSFQHLWSLSSWNHLHTEQVTYTRCVMSNNIQFGALWYELLLNEWQPRITRRYSHEKNVSNKKEHFSLTLVPRLTIVLLSLHYILPIRRPVLGNQLLSTQKGGSQAWGLSWEGGGGLLWTWRSCTCLWQVDCLSVSW